MYAKLRNKLSIGFSLAVVLALVLASLALADNVVNDIAANPGSDTFTAGGSTSVGYKVVGTGGDGGPSGPGGNCNASDGTAATVTINNPAGVTATPGSLTFTTCNDFQNVTFSSNTAGDYSITVSVSDSGLGTYSTGPATFTLHVLAPPPPTDSTPPTITITTPADGATYKLNEEILASYVCTDEETTVTKCEGPVAVGAAIDTSTVGKHTFKVDATSGGGSSYKEVYYYVLYQFGGFFSPVDNPTVMNSAKAGQAIPLKWRLTDAGGNPVTDLASVKVTAVTLTCSVGTTTDLVEEYAAGASGLQNLGDGYYQFNWKTPTSYASSCKTMKLDLGEGAGYEHLALFQFKK